MRYLGVCAERPQKAPDRFILYFGFPLVGWCDLLLPFVDSHLDHPGCLTGWWWKASSTKPTVTTRGLHQSSAHSSQQFQHSQALTSPLPQTFSYMSSISLAPQRQSTFRPVCTHQHNLSRMMKTVPVLILLCVCLGPVWAVGSSVDQALQVLATCILILRLLPVILCGADCPLHMPLTCHRSQTTCHCFNTRASICCLLRLATTRNRSAQPLMVGLRLLLLGPAFSALPIHRRPADSLQPSLLPLLCCCCS